MFGIGSTELLLILLVALIVLGPKSLGKFSRSLGKAVGEFRRVSTDFQRTLNMETAQAEARESKNASVTSQQVNIPPDSPLAEALAEAKSKSSKSANNNE